VFLFMTATWDYRSLQASDLPKKAQHFISMMDIDMDEVTLMLLKPNPNGTYFKSFNKGGSSIPNPEWAAVAEAGAIYFFNDYSRVSTAIHELAHIFFQQARFNKRIKYDLQGIGIKFITEHDVTALSYYAQINMYEDNWEEVVCEIIATYGRRGQFNKIQELLNQQCRPMKKGEF
jgi:hypothetical protein